MTAKKEREDKSPSDKLAVNDPAGGSSSKPSRRSGLPSGSSLNPLMMLNQQQFLDPVTTDNNTIAGTTGLPMNDTDQIDSQPPVEQVQTRQEDADIELPPLPPSLVYTYGAIPTELVSQDPYFPSSCPPTGIIHGNIQLQDSFANPHLPATWWIHAVQDPYFPLLHPPGVHHGVGVQEGMQSIPQQIAGSPSSSEEVNSNQVPATDNNTAMEVNNINQKSLDGYVQVIEKVEPQEQKDAFSQIPVLQGLPKGYSNALQSVSSPRTTHNEISHLQDSSTKQHVPDTAVAPLRLNASFQGLDPSFMQQNAAPGSGQFSTSTTDVVTSSGSNARSLMLGLELHFSISETEALELSDIRIRPGSGIDSIPTRDAPFNGTERQSSLPVAPGSVTSPIVTEHPSSHGTRRDFTLQVQLRPGNGISSHAPEDASFHGTGREFALQLELQLRQGSGISSHAPGHPPLPSASTYPAARAFHTGANTSASSPQLACSPTGTQQNTAPDPGQSLPIGVSPGSCSVSHNQGLGSNEHSSPSELQLKEQGNQDEHDPRQR